MPFFIGIIAILQIIGGVLVFLVSKSAVHEILGSLSFGMGILSLSFAIVIVKLDQIRRSSEQTAASAAEAKTMQSKIVDAFERIGRA